MNSYSLNPRKFTLRFYPCCRSMANWIKAIIYSTTRNFITDPYKHPCTVVLNYATSISENVFLVWSGGTHGVVVIMLAAYSNSGAFTFEILSMLML